jgi:hypothetical protein
LIFQDIDFMCQLFEDHHTRLGNTCPDTLVAKMFTYIHEVYGVRRGSRARAEAPGDVSVPAAEAYEDDVVPGAEAHEDDAVPTARADVPAAETNVPAAKAHEDDTVPAAANISEKDFGGMADEFEGPVPAAASTPIVEDSVTEKIESDGLYDGSGSENWRASQRTVIISSEDSPCEGTLSVM